METIVDIVGLVVKINIVPTGGLLTRMLVESKTEKVITKVSIFEVDKIIESKIVILIVEEHKIAKDIASITDDINSVVEEEGCYSSVDEVVVSSINDVLSCEGAKSEWTFDVSIVFTIKLAKVVFELGVATGLAGE